MASVTGNQAASVPAAAPLASAACGGDASPDFGASFNLRVVTFFVVLTCSSLGIVLPLVLRFRQSLAGISRSSWLFLAKAFGAGVILAVGIIHVFPDASTALGDPCLGWQNYPWAALIATLSAVGVLMLEGCIQAFYERAHTAAAATDAPADVEAKDSAAMLGSPLGTQTDGVAAHPHGGHALDLAVKEDKIRLLTIALVLEAGIAVRSVLIGVGGVTSDMGTVRALLAALPFHQFFEGVALGACFNEAGITKWSYVVMGVIFAFSTPLGIAIGLGVQSTYNAHSPTALAVEGIFDSISAGILIFMALVDLIAVDFMDAKRPLRSKVQGFVALLLGVGCMAVIAYWA